MLTADVPGAAAPDGGSDATDPAADDVAADPAPAGEFASPTGGNTWNTPPLVFGAAMTTSDGNTVEIMGWVMDDENPEGLTVSISGVATGTATVDEFGSFTLIANVSALGTIHATVVDAGGLSGTGELSYTDARPEITMFQVQQMTDTQWMITGTVADEATEGLVVVFGGDLPSGLTAVVEWDGTFECHFTWNNPPSLGLATAVVDDVWSQTSDVAQDVIFV